MEVNAKGNVCDCYWCIGDVLVKYLGLSKLCKKSHCISHQKYMITLFSVNALRFAHLDVFYQVFLPLGEGVNRFLILTLFIIYFLNSW